MEQKKNEAYFYQSVLKTGTHFKNSRNLVVWYQPVFFSAARKKKLNGRGRGRTLFIKGSQGSSLGQD